MYPRPESEDHQSVVQQIGGLTNKITDLSSEGDAGAMASLVASMAGELNLDASGALRTSTVTTTFKPTGVTEMTTEAGT